MQQNIKNNKIKYPLAPATRRVLARFFDLFLLCVLSIGIFSAFTLWIFINDRTYYNQKLFCGMFLIANFTSILMFFIYFVVFPYFFGGYTLFMRMFKIKVYSNKKGFVFFREIIKRELFIWFLFFIINFILIIVLFFQNNPLEIIKELFIFNFSNENIMIPIFQFLYVLCIIPMIVITIHMVMRSGKRAIHDIFSNTYVILNKPIIENNKNTMEKKYSNLPGIIDEKALEEINNE